MTEPRPCPHCDDTGWVCEAHADRPMEGSGARACTCGAPGMPCRLCNTGSPPDFGRDGFTVTAAAEPFIVKMTLLKPAGGGAREREGALVQARNGQIWGWEITEPHIAAQFEGRDHAYFEAIVVDEHRIEIIRRVADQDW